MKRHNLASHGQRNNDGVTGATTTRARSEVVAEIVGRLSAGESVTDIFRAPGADYPSVATFWRWIADDPDLELAYSAAKGKGVERYADETLTIADEQPEFEKTQFGEKRDQGFIAWQKLRIETRKWHLSKLAPKKYGDRTVIAGDADNPIVIDDPKAVLARRLAAGIAGAGASGSDRGTD